MGTEGDLKTESADRVVIENEGLLDLTGAKTPDDLAHIRSIRNVGMVLLPETLTAAFAKIPQSNVGAVATIPVLEKGKLRVMTGQLKLAGDAFADEGNADDVVVLVGQIMFTSVVQTCRVRGLIAVGQVFAPQGSEAALSKAILRLTGQVVYFPATADPRLMIGKQDLADLYFQSLAKPIVLVVIGECGLDDDVTPASLTGKLAGLVVVGKMTCLAAIKPIVQALCSECIGTIEAALMSAADEFDALIRDCQAELFALLLARSPGREAAKDLLQEVLLDAWRHRSKVLPLPVDQRRRYLFTMAKNRAIDQARQSQRRGIVQSVFPEGDLASAPPPAADERLDFLERCMNKLPTDDRELLFLATMGELDSEMIADRVGSIPSTVRSRLSRIRRQLRDCITAAMERGQSC